MKHRVSLTFKLLCTSNVAQLNALEMSHGKENIDAVLAAGYHQHVEIRMGMTASEYVREKTGYKVACKTFIYNRLRNELRRRQKGCTIGRGSNPNSYGNRGQDKQKRQTPVRKTASSRAWEMRASRPRLKLKCQFGIAPVKRPAEPAAKVEVRKRFKAKALRTPANERRFKYCKGTNANGSLCRVHHAQYTDAAQRLKRPGVCYCGVHLWMDSPANLTEEEMSVVRCKGVTADGSRCRMLSTNLATAGDVTAPMRRGAQYCDWHADQECSAVRYFGFGESACSSASVGVSAAAAACAVTPRSPVLGVARRCARECDIAASEKPTLRWGDVDGVAALLRDDA